MPGSTTTAVALRPGNPLRPHPAPDSLGPMESPPSGPPFDQFLAAAEQVPRERPDVDVEVARELMLEAATMVHNGLALEGLDAHDTASVSAWLAADLVAVDPAAAVHDRAAWVLANPSGLHDADSVSRSCLIAASILRL